MVHIAYSKGIKYYCSIGEGKNGEGCTFAITTPSKSTLPEEILDLGRTLRKQHGKDVFIGSFNDMIIAGGPKNKDFALYKGEKSEDAKERIIEEIKSAFGIECDFHKQEETMEKFKEECESSKTPNKLETDLNDFEK